MIDFLKNWGTLIIAALALIQPWLLTFLKDIFKRQIVEAYEAGAMEIGFSNFGPTIGLQGTVRALHQDAFIHNITLKIVREKDRSEHIYQWGLFRPPAIASYQQMPMEICSSFLLTERSPRRLNILFLEQSAVNDMRPKLEKPAAGMD